MGPRYPYFGLLLTSPLGFKARVGSALFELSRGVIIIIIIIINGFILCFFVTYIAHLINRTRFVFIM